MIEFLKQNRIRFNNLLYWKGQVNQQEATQSFELANSFLRENKINVIGPLISCVHNQSISNNSNEKYEMEYYVPIDRRIDDNNNFLFVEEKVLHNCLICRYRGLRLGITGPEREIEEYLNNNCLERTSDVYSVLWGKNKNTMEIIVDSVFEIKEK